MSRFLVLILTVVVFSGCKPPANGSGGTNGSTGSNIANGGSTASANSSSSQPSFRNQEMTIGTARLVPKKLLGGKFEILVPEGFKEMDQAMIQTKYPAENRPNFVLTNDDGTINIAINHTQSRVAPSQLRQLHQQLDTSIRQAQPQAQWMFSGFFHHHGREWTHLEFVSQAVDTKIHNMMLATSADNRMLAVSFNATDELSAEWLPIGREVVNSVYYGD